MQAVLGRGGRPIHLKLIYRGRSTPFLALPSMSSSSCSCCDMASSTSRVARKSKSMLASAIVNATASLLSNAVSSAVENIGDWVWRKMYHKLSVPLTALLEEEIVRNLASAPETSTVGVSGEFREHMVPGLYYMLRTPAFYAFVTVEKSRSADGDRCDNGDSANLALYVPNSQGRVEAAKAFLEGFVGAPFETRDLLHAGPSTLFARILATLGKDVEELGLNIPHAVKLPNNIDATLFKQRCGEGRHEDELVLRVQRRPGLTQELLNASKALVMSHTTGVVFCRYPIRYGIWTSPVVLPSRQLSTVILPAAKLQDIVDDITEFMGAKEWYDARGIPYKRCYLFYGPPGTGKTSLMFALAAHFGLGMAIISDLLEPSVKLDTLVEALSDTDVLLMEDIDRQLTASKKYKLNIAEILSLFDGGPITANKRRITFISTNYPEKIDPVLMRPGRVDKMTYFGVADTDQACRMFARFYPDAPAGAAADFASALAPAKVVAAALQEHFIRHKRSYAAALNAVRDVRVQGALHDTLPVFANNTEDDDVGDVGDDITEDLSDDDDKLQPKPKAAASANPEPKPKAAASANPEPKPKAAASAPRPHEVSAGCAVGGGGDGEASSPASQRSDVYV